MIITVTLNAALDRTLYVDKLHPGALHRLKKITVDAGGKGVNVSKMIAAIGGVSIATGFLGGESGSQIKGALDDLGIRHDFVDIAGNTRTNIKIMDDGSRLTELNESGTAISEDELFALEQKVLSYADPGAIIVLSGSLPIGIDSNIYGRWTRLLRNRGAKVILDTSGEAMRHGITAAPDYIKPNLAELREYFSAAQSEELDTLREYCLRFLDEGAGAVALTMSERGAMFVERGRAFFVPGLKVNCYSPVGAGDCIVGAIAYALETNMNWSDAMTLAVAAAAGAVSTPGTKPPSKDLVEKLSESVNIIEL